MRIQIQALPGARTEHPDGRVEYDAPPFLAILAQVESDDLQHTDLTGLRLAVGAVQILVVDGTVDVT